MWLELFGLDRADSARDCSFLLCVHHYIRREHTHTHTRAHTHTQPLLLLDPELGVGELVDLALHGINQASQGSDLILGAISRLFKAVVHNNKMVNRCRSSYEQLVISLYMDINR
jgi:hypothetical protein